jgi:hypothetical protein
MLLALKLKEGTDECGEPREAGKGQDTYCPLSLQKEPPGDSSSLAL